jgi:hypothetical protein
MGNMTRYLVMYVRGKFFSCYKSVSSRLTTLYVGQSMLYGTGLTGICTLSWFADVSAVGITYFNTGRPL